MAAFRFKRSRGLFSGPYGRRLEAPRLSRSAIGTIPSEPRIGPFQSNRRLHNLRWSRATYRRYELVYAGRFPQQTRRPPILRAGTKSAVAPRLSPIRRRARRPRGTVDRQPKAEASMITDWPCPSRCGDQVVSGKLSVAPSTLIEVGLEMRNVPQTRYGRTGLTLQPHGNVTAAIWSPPSVCEAPTSADMTVVRWGGFSCQLKETEVSQPASTAACCPDRPGESLYSHGV